eukprot:TRINITY_DN13159_c0_g1_i1.p1 TRINITY_DN13159_c0_g1~~TRINITY_DN13159_c0_g1_i1.p1  ORF type:complete len:110 (+),score=23.14 TRINITY_DN13159_c0_g1_i1:48-377(+)
MVFRVTRRLFGGALHPDAFRGGRKPGTMFPETFGQISPWEWSYIIAGIAGCAMPCVLMYHRHLALEESAWVDEHYDPHAAYEREWANKHCPRDSNFRVVHAWPRGPKPE